MYEWGLAPPEAGLLEFQDEHARVLWEADYTGSAMISARVGIDDDISTWKRLKLDVVEHTALNMQSQDTALCEKLRLVLDLEASGHELVYDWYKDGSLWKQNSSDHIVFQEISKENSGVYYSVITGSCGIVKSADMSVTVYPTTGVLSQSPDVRASHGTTAVLDVVAEGQELSYQWEKDGVILPGENFSDLILSNVNSNHTGNYRVNLEGTCGSFSGDSIYLYVSSETNPDKPDVYIWPTISNAKFNVASNLDGPYDLQVFNIRGQLIKRMDNLRYTEIIDLSGKENGIHLVYIISGNWSKTIKIRKE